MLLKYTNSSPLKHLRVSNIDNITEKLLVDLRHGKDGKYSEFDVLDVHLRLRK